MNDNLFINRELSWLKFNQRVLLEAQNTRHPLMERLRFLAISDNNLDEFMMVRFAGLIGQDRANINNISIDGLDVKQQIIQVKKAVKTLIHMQEQTLKHILGASSSKNFSFIKPKNLSKTDITALHSYFIKHIFPALTPLTIDPSHPFPFIPNKTLMLTYTLRYNDDSEMQSLLIVPHNIERFIKLSWRRTRHIFIALEDVITLFYHEIFPNVTMQSHGVIRIIRDSNIEYFDEAEDLVSTYKNLLRKRRRGRIIAVYTHGVIDERFFECLNEHNDIDSDDCIASSSYLALNDLTQIIKKMPSSLTYKDFESRWPRRLKHYDNDCFAAIRKKDFIVHHPFEDFSVIVSLLRQAAHDKNVIAIKQTLYRTSHNSPIIQALIDAAEQGKIVTALLELKARFDEEANMKWAHDLEKAGVQVVYGFVNLKTHAKSTIIVRREGRNIRTYMHFGTGNYNPITAKVYTDISFLTCNDILARDATKIFNYMTGNVSPNNLEEIAVSPINLRHMLINNINNEREAAKQHKPAWVILKVNNLIDKAIIEALYEASQDGVHIDIIARGPCSLRPQVKGLSDNIWVRSIIGRFLEHSRIYAFGNSYPMLHSKASIYIASADIMERNLDRRIEVAIPLYNATVKTQILQQILKYILQDEANCWFMDEHGDYTRHPNALNTDAFSSHDYFLSHHSLSGTSNN